MACWTSISQPTTARTSWVRSALLPVSIAPFVRHSHHSCILHTDLAHWGWIAAAGWAGIDIDEFPTLKAWEERMAARQGVEKGRHVPDPHKIKELLKDKAKMDEYAAKSRAWVQKGMKEDAAKSQK